MNISIFRFYIYFFLLKKVCKRVFFREFCVLELGGIVGLVGKGLVVREGEGV